MNSDALRPLAVAALCVLAVGMAAATLADPVQTGTAGGGAHGSLPSSDDRSVGLPLFSDNHGLVGTEDGPAGGVFRASLPCVVFLQTWRAKLAILLALLVVFGLVAYRTNWLVSVGALAAVTPMLLLFYALLTACGSGTLVRLTGFGPLERGNATMFGGRLAGRGPGGAVADPALWALVVLAVGALAFLAVVVRVPDDARPDPPGPPPESEASLSAVGAAAGTAADRIEADADLDNAVFRAWRSMTDHLDVANPASSTPAEFASAAVAVGMAREDVEELTALFREVRYGGRDATPERERRAVAALRRIEAVYAEADR